MSIFFFKIFFPLVYCKIINIVDWAIQSIFKDMKKKANILLIISYNSKRVKRKSRHHPRCAPSKVISTWPSTHCLWEVLPGWRLRDRVSGSRSPAPAPGGPAHLSVEHCHKSPSFQIQQILRSIGRIHFFSRCGQMTRKVVFLYVTTETTLDLCVPQFPHLQHGLEYHEPSHTLLLSLVCVSSLLLN